MLVIVYYAEVRCKLTVFNAKIKCCGLNVYGLKFFEVLPDSLGFPFRGEAVADRLTGHDNCVIVRCRTRSVRHITKDFSTPRFAKSAISSQSWVLRSRSSYPGVYASESALRIQLRQTFCLPLF